MYIFLHSIYNMRFQDFTSSGAGVFCAPVDITAVELIVLMAWIKTNLVCMKIHVN